MTILCIRRTISPPRAPNSSVIVSSTSLDHPPRTSLMMLYYRMSYPGNCCQLLLLLLCSSENYLYAIQLKGTQGAKAWPVLWLVRLELKGSVQLKSRVKICIYVYMYIEKRKKLHFSIYIALYFIVSSTLIRKNRTT